jgi:hypothetical protein
MGGRMKGSLLAALIAGLAFPSSGRHAEAAEMKVGGFAQIYYKYDEGGAGSSNFATKRARLRATGTLADRLGFFAQMDFWGGPVIYGPWETVSSLASPTLLDLRLDYQVSPLLKLSAGQFALPFGLEIQTSPFNLEVVNYSYVVGAGWNYTGYFPYLRDVGIMA